MIVLTSLHSSKKIAAASISSYALSKSQAFQSFHDAFWKAFAARQLEADLVHQFKKDIEIQPPLQSVPSVVHLQPRDNAEEINELTLQQLARNDLLKHAHMSASSRCMKRGDGVLRRNCYSLGVKENLQKGSNKHILPATPTLIDIETARSYREEMHRKFWEAYKNRNDRVTTQAQRSKVEKTSLRLSSKPVNRLPLPSTLHAAYLEFGFHEFSSQLKVRNIHPQAMAITEAQPPFKILDVNKEWVHLCGYSRKQSIGSTLKALLQGPETDLRVAKDLVSSLVQDDEAEAILTNYRYDGSKFRNLVRVGPIKNAATGQTTHFVGVFKKMNVDDNLSNASDDLFANM